MLNEKVITILEKISQVGERLKTLQANITLFDKEIYKAQELQEYVEKPEFFNDDENGFDLYYTIENFLEEVRFVEYLDEQDQIALLRLVEKGLTEKKKSLERGMENHFREIRELTKE